MPNPSLLAMEEEDRRMPAEPHLTPVLHSVPEPQEEFFLLLGRHDDVFIAKADLTDRGYKLATFDLDYGDNALVSLRAITRYALADNCVGVIVTPGWEDSPRANAGVYLATLLERQTLQFYGPGLLVQFDRSLALMVHTVCTVLDEVERLTRAETFFRPRAVPATPYPLTDGRDPLG